MKKRLKSILLLAAVLAAFYLAASFLNWLASPSYTELEADENMSTDAYHTDIVLGEDMSYTVTETIHVQMLTERHGIYRYIPVHGSFADSARNRSVSYYAELERLDCNSPVSEETDGIYEVYRLGDEDETVSGSVSYTLSYRWTPVFQKKDSDFSLAYYNIFPSQWQNPIPAGSGFTVTFPKSFDHEKVALYCGDYGSTERAEDILSLAWEGDTLTGTLTESLPLGSGITLYADMGEGYFASLHTDTHGSVLLALSLAVLAVSAALYWIFGRSEPMISSVQFEPPKGLDSAAVGCVIDGSAENKDVLSLILFWADQGLLTIRQSKKDIQLAKTKRPLPDNAPDYQKTLYNGLFRKSSKVSVNSLKYKFSDTLGRCCREVETQFKRHGVYTPASGRARAIVFVLAQLPGWVWFMALTDTAADGGMDVFCLADLLLIAAAGLILCHTVDKWYAMESGERITQAVLSCAVLAVGILEMTVRYYRQLYGGASVFDFGAAAAVAAASAAACTLFAAFMRRRTAQNAAWMGQLIGLRDFIENAELDRLKMLADENPQWFYHILPYAYVFGLSDVFASRLEALAIPQPDWYTGRGNFVNYYVFIGTMHDTMDDICQTLTVSRSSSSGGSGSGGSSSGGFSGGGGGGGGGGSW